MKCRPLLPPVISSQIKLNYCNGVSLLLTEVSRYAGLSLLPDDVFDGGRKLLQSVRDVDVYRKESACFSRFELRREILR